MIALKSAEQLVFSLLASFDGWKVIGKEQRPANVLAKIMKSGMFLRMFGGAGVSFFLAGGAGWGWVSGLYVCESVKSLRIEKGL